MASGYSGGSIGSFAPGGYIGSARLGLIGEAGAEWVGPNWMLISPKYANIFEYLESERQRGSVRAFADGGPTGAANQIGAAVDKSDLLLMALQIIAENQARYHGEISQWQRELHTNYYSGSALEADNRRAQVEDLASW